MTILYKTIELHTFLIYPILDMRFSIYSCSFVYHVFVTLMSHSQHCMNYFLYAKKGKKKNLLGLSTLHQLEVCLLAGCTFILLLNQTGQSLVSTTNLFQFHFFANLSHYTGLISRKVYDFKIILDSECPNGRSNAKKFQLPNSKHEVGPSKYFIYILCMV